MYPLIISHDMIADSRCFSSNKTRLDPKTRQIIQRKYMSSMVSGRSFHFCVALFLHAKFIRFCSLILSKTM